MPTSFQLSPLPSVISSWITCTLEKLNATTVSKTKHARDEIEHGSNGCPGWTGWASTENPILLGLSLLNKPAWLAVFLSVSVDVNTVLPDTRSHWLQGQSACPSRIWRQPFRMMINPTPNSTHTPTSIATSPPSSNPSRNWIQKRKRKRPSHHRS